MEDAKNSPPRDICERTFEFATRVTRLCVELGKSPGAPRLLAHQLFKSGSSIGANVEEAQAGQSRSDFISKYSIALKEARETGYWLRLVVATDLMKRERVVGLLQEITEITKVIAAIICSAKRNA